MKAFISYSHRDEAKLKRLHKHLVMLRRDGGISDWVDREIKPGEPLDRAISKELDRCQLFLALVSPDFLDSRYCYEKEMTRALERYEAGELVIVPVHPWGSSRRFLRMVRRSVNGRMKIRPFWMWLPNYVV
jgi:hypothetical protein